MIKKDIHLLEGLYRGIIISENYNLGSDFTEFTGDYENDLMFYADYDGTIVEQWIKSNRPLQTKYVAMGEDLVEMGIQSVNPESVYIFNKPTDFTHMALIATS